MCRSAERRSVQMCGQCHSDMRFSDYKYFSSYVDEQIFLVYSRVICCAPCICDENSRGATTKGLPKTEKEGETEQSWVQCYLPLQRT